MTPFGGSARWTPAGELTREEVNSWILTSGAFDGVIEMDRELASADVAGPWLGAFDDEVQMTHLRRVTSAPRLTR